MKTSSIRVNLLTWLIVPGLLVLGVGAWLSYQQALRLSTIVTDQQLTASARMIAEQVGYADGGLTVTVPPAALELFASDSHDEVAYAVADPNGTLIAGYPGSIVPQSVLRGAISCSSRQPFEMKSRCVLSTSCKRSSLQPVS